MALSCSCRTILSEITSTSLMALLQALSCPLLTYVDEHDDGWIQCFHRCPESILPTAVHPGHSACVSVGVWVCVCGRVGEDGWPSLECFSHTTSFSSAWSLLRKAHGRRV